MATTTTNFGWDIPQSTDLVKDGATAIATLGQDIDTAFVDLKGGTTGQVLKKNSNTDLDFVWSADSAGMTNPMTTTGDTIYSSSGSTPARLGIGSSGQVLTVSGGVPTWATPAAGGMTLLASGTFSGSTTTLSSISSSYKQLRLLITNLYMTLQQNAYMQVNNDTSSIYSPFSSKYTNAGTASVYAATGPATDSEWLGNTGAIYNAAHNNVFDYTFTNYADTNSHKIWHSDFWTKNSSTAWLMGEQWTYYGSTSAISSIKFTAGGGGSFSGGNYYLYGVN